MYYSESIIANWFKEHIPWYDADYSEEYWKTIEFEVNDKKYKLRINIFWYENEDGDSVSYDLESFIINNEDGREENKLCLNIYDIFGRIEEVEKRVIKAHKLLLTV